MIRALSMTSDKNPHWQQNLQSIWLDVFAPTEQELAELQQHLKFNPLALEDARQEGQWSRFELYPEHAFLVYRTLKTCDTCSDDTERISLFWYPETDTLVTVRLKDVKYLDQVWETFEPVTHGIEERVIYNLLSRGADQFFRFTDLLNEETNRMEEDMFLKGSKRDLVKVVFRYKHMIMEARRLVSTAREAVAAFARHSTLIGEEAGRKETQELTLYLRDIVDVLGRTHESLDSSREVLSSILDINLTVQSNKMNEVMKTLATVSTIFLPLTFLAGVWGMNFEHMPELSWRYGYLFAWVCFVAVGSGLAYFFKRKGWW